LLDGNINVVTDELVELVGNLLTLWQLLEGIINGFDQVVSELVSLLEGLLDGLWNSDLVVINKGTDLSSGHGFLVLEVQEDLLGKRHLEMVFDHLLASNLGSATVSNIWDVGLVRLSRVSHDVAHFASELSALVLGLVFLLAAVRLLTGLVKLELQCVDQVLLGDLAKV